MKRRTKLAIVTVSVMALAVAAAPAFATGARVPGIRISGGEISLSGKAAAAGGTLTLRGPDGFKQVHQVGSGQPLSVPLLADGGAALADGLYRFNLRPNVVSKDSRPEFGVFYVENGQIVSRRGKRETLARQRGELAGAAATGPSTRMSQGGLQSVGGPSQELVTPDYLTVADVAGDGSVGVYLSTTYGFGNTFEFFNNYGFAGFLGYPAVYAYPYPIGYVGINYFGNAFMGALGYSTFFNTYFYTVPMQIQPAAPHYSLMLTGTGLGIGTVYPSADFHLTNLDGAGDTVFKLDNAGSWNLGTTGTGVFTFNKAGTGGQEATFRDRLDAGGATFEVQGSVKATNVVFPSSRALKTGFKAMDPAGVLGKVADLPMSSWRFKTDPDEMVRFGPVAEDFHAAFGVGNGKTLSMLDVQGVSLAAIQGLNARLDEQDDALRAKDVEIVDLRRTNAVLEERLAAIEARLAEGSP